MGGFAGILSGLGTALREKNLLNLEYQHQANVEDARMLNHLAEVTDDPQTASELRQAAFQVQQTLGKRATTGKLYEQISLSHATRRKQEEAAQPKGPPLPLRGPNGSGMSPQEMAAGYQAGRLGPRPGAPPQAPGVAMMPEPAPLAPPPAAPTFSAQNMPGAGWAAGGTPAPLTPPPAMQSSPPQTSMIPTPSQRAAVADYWKTKDEERTSKLQTDRVIATQAALQDAIATGKIKISDHNRAENEKIRERLMTQGTRHFKETILGDGTVRLEADRGMSLPEPVYGEDLEEGAVPDTQRFYRVLQFSDGQKEYRAVAGKPIITKVNASDSPMGAWKEVRDLRGNLISKTPVQPDAAFVPQTSSTSTSRTSMQNIGGEMKPVTTTGGSTVTRSRGGVPGITPPPGRAKAVAGPRVSVGESVGPSQAGWKLQNVMQNTGVVLKSISDLSEKINTGQGIVAKIGGAVEKAKAQANLNDDVAEYEAMVQGFTPLVARAVGHIGVLTQQDVDSVRAMFPKPGDSKTLRDRKIARVNTVLAGQAGARAMAAPPNGKVLMVNQQGQEGWVPAEQVDAATEQGYKKK